MIDFLESWPLFFRPYTLTLLASAVLAVIGVVATARRQLFMAAAVAQTSLMGYAIMAFVFGAHIDGTLEASLRDTVVILAAVLAAMITMLGSRDSQSAQGGSLDGDERTAWVYVTAGSLGVLFLAHAPAGMEQVRRLQVSSVIGATWIDLATFALLFLGIALLMIWLMRPLILLLSDPVMAAAIGMKVTRWNVILAILAGLSVGLAVRSTGVLFAFGALAIPVMIAKQIAGEVRSLFLLAPLLAIMLSFTGLWLGHLWDFPPGQAAVSVMCLALLITHLARLAWNRIGIP
ncbi:metal ABC transporter permease [Mucisphaera sp.]|uniref:metal ABC transporter permease n=1 Tax=Mucisphaera sp. TaxID=2913024 RepID=UPI003D134654